MQVDRLSPWSTAALVYRGPLCGWATWNRATRVVVSFDARGCVAVTVGIRTTMSTLVVTLVDGDRNGQQVEVLDGVTRLCTASEAPGLVDVYEMDRDDPGLYRFAGQEPALTVTAELQHSISDVPSV